MCFINICTHGIYLWSHVSYFISWFIKSLRAVTLCFPLVWPPSQGLGHNGSQWALLSRWLKPLYKVENEPPSYMVHSNFTPTLSYWRQEDGWAELFSLLQWKARHNIKNFPRFGRMAQEFYSWIFSSLLTVKIIYAVVFKKRKKSYSPMSESLVMFVFSPEKNKSGLPHSGKNELFGWLVINPWCHRSGVCWEYVCLCHAIWLLHSSYTH